MEYYGVYKTRRLSHAMRWITIPAHDRVVDGKTEHVQEYRVQRDINPLTDRRRYNIGNKAANVGRSVGRAIAGAANFFGVKRQDQARISSGATKIARNVATKAYDVAMDVGTFVETQAHNIASAANSLYSTAATKVGDIKRGVGQFAENMKAAYNKGRDWLTRQYESLRTKASAIFDSVKNSKFGKTVGNAYNTVAGGAVAGAARTVGGAIGSAASSVGGFISNLWSRGMSLISNLFNPKRLNTVEKPNPRDKRGLTR